MKFKKGDLAVINSKYTDGIVEGIVKIMEIETRANGRINWTHRVRMINHPTDTDYWDWVKEEHLDKPTKLHKAVL